MTQFDRHIYNTFLRVSRSSKNLPFKLRQNFNNFEDDPNYGYVMRLNSFFKRFPHINIETFFMAPYKVYPDGADDYFNLKFYITPKATKMYGIYQSQRDNELPDSEAQISFIKESLMYIFKFCKTHDIDVEQYPDHKSTGDLYSFIDHLRERSVSVYTLFGFDKFERRLHEYPNSRLDFTLGENFMKELASRKIRYYNSNNAKCIAETGLDKIKTLLHKITK